MNNLHYCTGAEVFMEILLGGSQNCKVYGVEAMHCRVYVCKQEFIIYIERESV